MTSSLLKTRPSTRKSSSKTFAMRVHYVALLVAALVATASATATDSQITTQGMAWSIAVDQGEVPARRLLRSKKTPALDDDKENDEERVFGVNIAFLDEFVEKVQLNSKVNELLKKRTSANDAFGLLNVDAAAENIFKNKEWQTWATYVAMLNKGDQEQSLAAAMTFRFGGDGLSKMLAKAANDPSTKEIATKLESAQLSRWLSLGSSPDQIFTLMKLDKATDNIFNTPQFATWSNYLKAFNGKYPGKKASELEVFTKHYAEDGLLKMLASADNGDTAVTAKLKGALVQGWLEFTTPPANIFKLLKLDDAGDALFSSPLLSTWVQYMKLFNEKIPRKKTSMIQQFTKSYGDEKLAMMIQAATKVDDTEQFAKNLQKAQFKQWMVDGKSPDNIYKTVLKLESTNSPNADIWRTYYKAYDEQFPGKLFSFNP